MEQRRLLAPSAGLRVTKVKRGSDRWLISASGPGHACAQRIFAERLPAVADRYARWTGEIADIVQLLGHGSGGRPAERILQRRGLPVSDDTVLNCTVASRLFTKFKHPGCTDCYTHLAQYVVSWRRAAGTIEKTLVAIPSAWLPCDPTIDCRASPQIAAALCLKPRPRLTPRQGSAVDALEAVLPDFAIMRRLAMQLRSIPWSHDTEVLDRRLHDAHHPADYAMQHFAGTLQQDLDALRNARASHGAKGRWKARSAV